MIFNFVKSTWRYDLSYQIRIFLRLLERDYYIGNEGVLTINIELYGIELSEINYSKLSFILF